MLNYDQLKKLDKTPIESDISLKLYAEFYNKYVANRKYEIQLKSGDTINLKIAPINFAHLIGLHKFVDPKHNNPYMRNIEDLSKFKGYLNAFNEKIKMEDLKLSKKGTVYNEYKHRIINFPLIYQVIRNSKFLKFDRNKVESKNSLINGNYLFVKDVDNKKIHFFIVKDNNFNYPMTFLTTRPNDTHFEKNQEILEIDKITIRDIKNDKVLSIIKDGQEVKNKSEKNLIVSKNQLNYLKKNNVNIQASVHSFNKYKISFSSEVEQVVIDTLNKYQKIKMRNKER